MALDLQPTLGSDLVSLRPLRPDEFEALYAAAADPLIWEQHPEPLRHRRDVFRTFFDGAIASKGALVVTDVTTGAIIGSSRYYDYAPERREVTIGYTFLARAYWGGRYNGEVKRLMLDHAFAAVDRVLFEVGAQNLRSQKALQKLGAREIKRSDLPSPDGTLVTHITFAITP